MLEDKRYKIVKMHICSPERKHGILVFNTKKYPERLCVHDKKNNIVIDVETKHEYPYIRVTNMQDIYNKKDATMLMPNTRVACMEYGMLIYDLDFEQLEECQNIIRLLQAGKFFPKGNLILSNEQYLEMINNSKNDDKTKKIGRKRK